MDDYIYYLYTLIILLAIIVAWIFYDLFSKISKKEKVAREIKKMFNAKELDGEIYFNFRGYDVIITLKPEIKASIIHNRNVEGIKSPKGTKLTPLYLTFKIKNVGKMGDKLEEYVDFLNSIPTQ